MNFEVKDVELSYKKTYNNSGISLVNNFFLNIQTNQRIIFGAFCNEQSRFPLRLRKAAELGDPMAANWLAERLSREENGKEQKRRKT